MIKEKAAILYSRRPSLPRTFSDHANRYCIPNLGQMRSKRWNIESLERMTTTNYSQKSYVSEYSSTRESSST
jgi:hypothetical protein